MNLKPQFMFRIFAVNEKPKGDELRISLSQIIITQLIICFMHFKYHVVKIKGSKSIGWYLIDTPLPACAIKITEVECPKVRFVGAQIFWLTWLRTSTDLVFCSILMSFLSMPQAHRPVTPAYCLLLVFKWWIGTFKLRFSDNERCQLLVRFWILEKNKLIKS